MSITKDTSFVIPAQMHDVLIDTLLGEGNLVAKQPCRQLRYQRANSAEITELDRQQYALHIWVKSFLTLKSIIVSHLFPSMVYKIPC